MPESGIFKAAVQLPISERAAYLDRECGANAALRHEIEALLVAHDHAGEFMQRPPIADRTTTFGPGPERPGMRVGPYKLLQFLGEGGMGVVFLAEQTEPVRRMVALKIIKPGMDSSQVLARFEAERQALAIMDHPNIARVLDAGATDGRPYFVMELIKGVPITEFCDKNKLTTRQRLELFIPVCQAIQHAHMKGIIHRDIKPSNVMIALYDGKPTPKVIDFGVAKAMAEPLTHRTLFTHVGQVVGTFEYMSPEQATLNQLDIDTRSDIYALGVLLYELLTGLTPIDKDHLRTLALDQMLKAIREEEPMRPSARLTSTVGALATAAIYRGVPSQKLADLLRGEIDWIVMKCLEKDRDRRFLTATSLAQDIERYLRDEPVSACPPTLGYRAKKYFRKNKAFMTTIGTIAAMLLIGIAGTTWQMLRAMHFEDIAISRANEADDERKKMEKERDDKNKALLQARENERKERAARLDARRSLYGATMHLVPNAWKADNIAEVINLLDEQRPKPGEEDLRGFEWHYWNRLCRPDRQLKLDLGFETTRTLLSGDGGRLIYAKIIGNAKSEVGILDAISGKKLNSEFATHNSLGSLAVNCDGSRFAFHGLTKEWSSNRAFTYEIGRPEPIPVKIGHNFRRMAMSPTGNLLALVENLVIPYSGGRSTPWQKIRIWNLSENDKPPVDIQADAKELMVGSPCFSTDGSWLLAITHPAGAANNLRSTIRIWNTRTGASRLNNTLTEDSLFQVAFSPDGSRLAAMGIKDGTEGYLTLWEIAEGELKLLHSTPVKTIKLGLYRIAYSPDGKYVAMSRGKVPVNIYDRVHSDTLVLDVATKEIARTFRSAMSISDLTFSADSGQLIAAGYGTELGLRDGMMIQAWDLADPPKSNEVAKPKPGPGTPKSAGSADNRYLVRGDSSNVTILDPVTGATLTTLSAGRVGKLALSPDGSFIVTTPKGGRFLLADLGLDTVFRGTTVWELPTGKVLFTLKGHSGLEDIGSVIVSPDSKRIASVVYFEGGSEVKIWDAATGLELLNLIGPLPGGYLKFSQDGCQLMMINYGSGGGGVIMTWDATPRPQEVAPVK